MLLNIFSPKKRKDAPPKRCIPSLTINYAGRLVFKLHLQILAVHAGDVAQRNVFRALSGASASVGAVTETKLVHLSHHGAYAACCLDLALWKKSELANLR